MKDEYLLVIPVRLASKRLPNKPLIDFNGVPMIIATAINCAKVIPKKNIIIATDSIKIQALSKRYDFNCIVTSKKCLTGTDRLAEVAKKIKKKYYINLQGDEPIFDLKDIKKFLDFAKKNKSKILNGYCIIKSKKEFQSANTPKVVFDKMNRLLYMSRSEIPGNKKRKFICGFRQVCIYSFPRKKLLKFAENKKKNFFEKIEDIEILRFLEIGEVVKMIKLSSNSMSVDTKEDYIKALKIYKKNN
jgi:3-deoxy-manno-octulosonate cytidylyltransferase (CMP-KDO synthetase)